MNEPPDSADDETLKAIKEALAHGRPLTPKETLNWLERPILLFRRHGKRGPLPKRTLQVKVWDWIANWYRLRRELPKLGADARRKISDDDWRDVLDYAAKYPRRLIRADSYSGRGQLLRGIQKHLDRKRREQKRLEQSEYPSVSDRTIERKIEELMPAGWVDSKLHK